MRIFEFNPTYWMVDMVSWSQLSNSGVVFKRTDKWLAGHFNWSNYIESLSPWTYSEFTLIINFKLNKSIANQPSNFPTFFDKYTLSTWWFWISSSKSSNSIFMRVISWWAIFDYLIAGAIIWTNYNQLVLSYWWWLRKSYLNWVLLNSTSVSYTADNKNITIWSYGTWTLSTFLEWNIYWVYLYDNVLSLTEIKTEYKRFLQLQPLLEKKTNFFYPKLTELKKPWLVGAWNMKPNGTTLVDISGNWRNITLSWTYPTRNWLFFNWIWSSQLSSSITPVTISFIVKKATSSSDVFLSQAAAWWTFVVYITSLIQLWFVETWWVWNVLAGFNMPVNVTITITIVHKTTSTDLYVNWSFVSNTVWAGARTLKPIAYIWWYFTGSPFYYKWEVEDLRLFSTQLPATEIKDYHNKWARQIVFKETFAYDKADWTKTIPNGWINWTWAYKLVTETTWNAIVKKWTKYLQCTSSWAIAFPSKQAYWTWEFNCKRTLTNQVFVYLNCQRIASQDSNYWYRFYITTSNELALVFENFASWTAIILTSSNYVAVNTDYRIRITRWPTWQWWMYIKWGIRSNWHTVVALPAYPNWWANNTYTWSDFFNVDLDSGSTISDIVIKQWIEV